MHFTVEELVLVAAGFPSGMTGGSVTCPPSGFEAPAELVRKIETPADLPAIDEFN